MNDYPFLLALVEGPSEAREHDDGGVVRAVIEHVFGAEVADRVKVEYWRRIKGSPAHASPGGKRLGSRAAQVAQAIKLAHATTAYGAVIVVDNDHHYEGAEPLRLKELREGADASGLADRAAIGIAREMVEAWLLADPDLLGAPLPAGKRCEELWGDKHDKTSNYPKHVVIRCILEPKQLLYGEALRAWSVTRARPHARSLDDFVRSVEGLADRQYAR